MAKSTEFDKNLKAALNDLQARNTKWDSLREQVRYGLAPVLLERDEDRQTPHGVKALDLLAALSSLSNNRGKTDVGYFGVKNQGEHGSVTRLSKLYSPHQIERASFIARNPEMSRLVIHDILSDLLTDGEYATDTVYRYSSYTLSELLPHFWKDVWTYAGNRAWGLFTADNPSDTTAVDPAYLAGYLCRGVAEYFTKFGLEKVIKLVNINAIDDLMYYVAGTDDEQNIVARRVSLFNPRICTSGDVEASISELAYKHADAATDDPNTFSDPDEWQVLNILNKPSSKNAPENVSDILNVRTVHEKSGRPQHIDMQFICADTTLFRDMPQINHIGFGVVVREHVLGMRDITEREHQELAAAFHEVASADGPIEDLAKPVKRRKALRPEDERQELIGNLFKAKQLTRRTAERMSLEQLRRRWSDYIDDCNCDDEEDDE